MQMQLFHIANNYQYYLKKNIFPKTVITVRTVLRLSVCLTAAVSALFKLEIIAAYIIPFFCLVIRHSFPNCTLITKSTASPVCLQASTDIVYCTACFSGHQQIGSITQ